GSGLPPQHPPQIKPTHIPKINTHMNSPKKNPNNSIHNITPKTQPFNQNLSNFSIQYTTYIPFLLHYLHQDNTDKLAEPL
ncbi:hypothetical protein, partial [Bacillus thuringiensis]|uniref:hypothetical protein n=1 Tax=Bacillus thuringiensis TaxID=1428 RepID=UPI001C92CBE1